MQGAHTILPWLVFAGCLSPTSRRPLPLTTPTGVAGTLQVRLRLPVAMRLGRPRDPGTCLRGLSRRSFGGGMAALIVPRRHEKSFGLSSAILVLFAIVDFRIEQASCCSNICRAARVIPRTSSTPQRTRGRRWYDHWIASHHGCQK